MKIGRPVVTPTDDEIKKVAALRSAGMSWQKVLHLTKITPYKLRRIRNIIDPDGFAYYKAGRREMIDTMRSLSRQGATYEDLAKAFPEYSVKQLRDMASAYSLTFGVNRHAPISREQLYDLVVNKRMYERDIAKTMKTTVKCVRKLKKLYDIYMPSIRVVADEGSRSPLYDKRRADDLARAKEKEAALTARLTEAIGTGDFEQLWDSVKALRVKVAALEAEYDKECHYERISFHQDAI